MEKPNERQVAGNHYKGGRFQHWDWWIANCGVSGLAYAATKYICRWRDKGGVKDLEKALHYVEKIVEAHLRGCVIPVLVPLPKPRTALYMARLGVTYAMEDAEITACNILVSYSCLQELNAVENILKNLIEKEKQPSAT